MTEFQRDIFSLIKSAVFSAPVKISKDFDWGKAVKLGLNHKILPLLYYGAHNSGINIPDEIEESLLVLVTRYLITSEQQLQDLDKIKNLFNKANIKYMPLKGSVLKSYYPRPELRPMGDIDILIDLDQLDKISECMAAIGYVEEKTSDHEIKWFKGERLIELHKRLIPSYNVDFYNYFGDGWKLAKPVSEGSNVYELSCENAFIYLFTHFAKHYRDAGIGILHLVDLLVFTDRHKNLDLAFVKREIKKLGLYEFYINVMFMLGVCFSGAKATDISDHIINKIFESGSYGNLKTQILSTAVKSTKNVKHKRFMRFTLFLKRVFMPYRGMCNRHKILKKLPFLLPFFWIYRIFSVLLFKRKNIKIELNYLKASDAESILNYYEDLKLVGLDFNFDE